MSEPRLLLMAALAALSAGAVPAAQQTASAPSGLALYQALKAFHISGKTAVVEHLVLKRDRAELTFTGMFHFEAPVDGRIHGAVFLGRGAFRAEPPHSSFERENLRRLIKADIIESDFDKAVLRFTDGTGDEIGGAQAQDGVPSPPAQELAVEFEKRLLKETGANVSARLAISLLNGESPGFFVAQFEGGRRGRFTFLFDHQGRIPASVFGINAGEKGLIFTHRTPADIDVWLAFHSLDDYQRGRVEYSDVHDLVAIRHYRMEADVREPKRTLKLEALLDAQTLRPGTRAVPFTLNEGLQEIESERLKKALRVTSAKLGDGPLEFAQEDWEIGFTFFLPAALSAGQVLRLAATLEGDFLFDHPYFPNVYYPRATTEWFPRHGYLRRSTFDATFRHRKQDSVAAVGMRVREEADPASDSARITRYRMDTPVSPFTFGVGLFDLHKTTTALGGVPIEFHARGGFLAKERQTFMLTELTNCLQYFSQLFGPYPYLNFAAVYHPRGFGQGLATLLLLPRVDRESPRTFSFIAHETAHQWWGNVVAWRSYRDQWLSEGFAEYSGVLYVGVRSDKNAQQEILRRMRRTLVAPPVIDMGPSADLLYQGTEIAAGKGRLAEVGAIVLGHRLATRETMNACTALVYNKGALILRMLHFLLSDPSTGEDTAFFDMLREFVSRHQNGSATTDSFRQVASEYFARSPIARKYGLRDLGWFFHQWVYQATLPSYRLKYQVESQPDGTVIVSGKTLQFDVPNDWFMPLPVHIRFGKDKFARGTVSAMGPENPFSFRLPAKPEAVELDPDLWVLSASTSSN